MKAIRLLPAFLLVLASSGRPARAAGEMVFPGRAWEQATPESQGVDSTKLQAAVDFLREAAGRQGVKRMVVVRNGRMIWRGPESEAVQGIWSVTKAFTSTAQGLLIEDGKCTLETLAKDYDPALAEYYPTVTLRHFATMTSGLDGAGGSYDFDDRHRGDQNALVEPLAPFFPPGTKFMYWDEATQHYGYTLTQIAGESLHDYLKRRILDPIGITRFNWQNDTTRKVLNWTGGIEISAEDLARFGLLYLNRGSWNGRQLISAKWVDEATRVQVPASIPNALPNSTRKGSGVYGYHWWPNGVTPEGKRRWPDAPPGTYARSGYNNNDLFVIPAWNMVTVRLGLDEKEDPITTAEYNTFLRIIGEAILDRPGDGQPKLSHAPYPPSPVIAGIRWAPPETIVRRAKGSDNFPLTWSDDDAIYTTYGDGYGFEPFVEAKLSLGLARITGMARSFRGVNLRSDSIEQHGDGRKGRKAWGLLSVQGVLYMWLGHADRNGGQAQLAWSKDHGATWSLADWRFAEFGLVGFVNFGKDYAGARDAFVYAYSHDGPKPDGPADRFVLMRAPRDRITEREAWEFFVRRNGRDGPIWSRDIRQRGGVFEHRDACLRSAMTYDAGIGRYLWWQAVPQPPGHKDRGDTRFDGGFGVYDAPEPWGPWTTAFYTDRWDTGPGEHGDFPTKWMSDEGRTLYLVFSGDDHFCVRKATLDLRQPATTIPAPSQQAVESK